MTNLTTFVTFGTAAAAALIAAATLGLSDRGVVAFAREMARLTAAIAGLLLLRTSAFTA